MSSSICAQTKTIPDAAAVKYPGMVEHFEKLIQVVNDRFNNRQNFLLKNGKTFSDVTAVTALDLEPDFLNSIILFSDAGYMKLAANSKCRFYDTILTDLLRNSEGKIRNIHVTYVSTTGSRESAVVAKKDFLNKVVSQECPETRKLINQFQVNNLDQTIKNIQFERPAGKEHCLNIHLGWLNNPQTPYLCQIHEYIKEVRLGGGDATDLESRRAVARVLTQKVGPAQLDYLENLCTHLDEPQLFCDSFMNTSFWAKVGAGYQDSIYAEDICRSAMKAPSLSNVQLKECLRRLNQEEDLCLYPAGRSNGLLPQPNCDLLSTALNNSGLRSNYRDCPQNSSLPVVSNMGRILLHFTKEEIKPFAGTCASISAGVTLGFNKKFDNDESWQLEACYPDKINKREVCHRTYFGEYSDQPEAITNVVARILRATRGAANAVKCRMVDSQDYNPLLLDFKSGCHIIYDRDKCFINSCQPRIIYNDRSIDFVTFKGNPKFNYFPNNVREERFSQHYLLTHDFQRKGRILNNLTAISNFFKKTKGGLIHGVGCAEDLLPSFFRSQAFNQCQPLPFIIDGMLEDDAVIFVTRTAIDSLQAPRLISWSHILSAIKSYQRQHPLKLWTLYGLD